MGANELGKKAIGDCAIDTMEAAQAAIEEMGYSSSQATTNDAPKKRSLALTGYVACLGFLMFCITIVDSLIREIMQNERLLSMMKEWNKNSTE